ncbi:Charged multivesicular body protein 7 [Morella rubra]|uniref:Charged multivesicular body protein 7 n=1 Tax=Morella rubra TaxID=262757 RepID=A0A6A1WJR5_9ROSI|nr:Charged multivesicular body protein 7 [Morella rubra]
MRRWPRPGSRHLAVREIGLGTEISVLEGPDSQRRSPSPLLIIRPLEVKNNWFNRGGLTPLCLDQVLLEMYSEGEIVRVGDLLDPKTSGTLSLLLSKVRRNLILIRPASPSLPALLQDHLVLTTLLKERAVEVVKHLGESHWTGSCIVTMGRFQDICGGPGEASAVLSHLSETGKARYLSVRRKEFIEGVKVSLSSVPVSNVSNLDYDVLHLVSTSERLQQQLKVIDRRCEVSRNSALASLSSGNKKMALRYARELKLVTGSRDKCTMFLNRVEEVLSLIANAESTKKVSEAIQIGAQAIKENKISVEEVEFCLQELEESIESQKQVEKALESTPLQIDVEDEDIEEELKNLELEVESENLQAQISKTRIDSVAVQAEASESAEALSDALTNLKLSGNSTRKSAVKNPVLA